MMAESSEVWDIGEGLGYELGVGFKDRFGTWHEPTVVNMDVTRLALQRWCELRDIKYS